MDTILLSNLVKIFFYLSKYFYIIMLLDWSLAEQDDSLSSLTRRCLKGFVYYHKQLLKQNINKPIVQIFFFCSTNLLFKPFFLFTQPIVQTQTFYFKLKIYLSNQRKFNDIMMI